MQHRIGNFMADPVSRHAAGTAVPVLLSTGSVCQEGSAKHTADVGLLPVRRRRHQVLMDALVGGERSDPASLFGSPRSSSQSPSPERGEQVTSCLTANTLPLQLLSDSLQGRFYTQNPAQACK